MGGRAAAALSSPRVQAFSAAWASGPRSVSRAGRALSASVQRFCQGVGSSNALKPRYNAASASASRTTYSSGFPGGWACTDSRPDTSRNFGSRGRRGPSLASTAAPRIATSCEARRSVRRARSPRGWATVLGWAAASSSLGSAAASKLSPRGSWPGACPFRVARASPPQGRGIRGTSTRARGAWAQAGSFNAVMKQAGRNESGAS